MSYDIRWSFGSTFSSSAAGRAAGVSGFRLRASGTFGSRPMYSRIIARQARSSLAL